MAEQTSQKKIFNAKSLAICALLIAITFVVNNFMPKIHLPFGGSATIFSMFILFLTGYFYGPVVGIIAAVAYGFLDMAAGASIVHPLQVILDYPLAFGMLGLGGFFSNKKRGLQIGYIVSILGRFLIVTLSGAIFWAEYTPDGWNFILWSIVYNGTYIGIEGLITFVLICIPQVSGFFEKLKRKYA